MTPSVSVALCTHNGARFVAQQVRSILDQSAPPFELVVSDDASTDDTIAIIEREWQAAHGSTQLRVIRNTEPLGVTRNFEQAILACSGELVALSDQDDIWHRGRLEVLVERFTSDPDLDLMFSDADLIDADGSPIGSLFDSLEIAAQELDDVRRGAGFAVLLRRNLVTGATVVMRRRLGERAAPFPAEWVHDEWLAIIAAATASLDWTPQRLIGYRQHGSNEIGVRAPTLAYKIRRVIQPRGSRYTGLLARSRVLLERLHRLDVTPSEIALAEGKVAHDEFRATLPKSRAARVLPVLRSARRGDYDKYCSRRRLDVARDLLSPVR